MTVAYSSVWLHFDPNIRKVIYIVLNAPPKTSFFFFLHLYLIGKRERIKNVLSLIEFSRCVQKMFQLMWALIQFSFSFLCVFSHETQTCSQTETANAPLVLKEMSALFYFSDFYTLNTKVGRALRQLSYRQDHYSFSISMTISWLCKVTSSEIFFTNYQ